LENKKQFKEERVSEKVEDYRESFHNNKPQNILQRRTGLCPLMPVIRGELPFRSLNKERDTIQVKMELRFCGLSDEGPCCDGLIARRKANEGNAKFFKTRCPDVDLEFIRLARKGGDDDEGI
jgi:hypothetical protein